MEQMHMPEQSGTQKEKKNPPILFLLIFLFLCLGVAAWYTAPQWYSVISMTDSGVSSGDEFGFSEERGVNKHQPSGKIFLTLAPQGDRAVDIFSFDVKKRDQGLTTLVPETGFVRNTTSIAPDLKTVMFSETTFDRSSPHFFPSRDFFQITTYDLETGERNVRTNSNTYYKQVGEWSPDGTMLAFSAMPENSPEFTEPDNWAVYTLRNDNDFPERMIDVGTHPQWSPDGKKILYMKESGLHIYDLDRGSSFAAYSIPGGTNVNMRYDISPDKQLLVWSVPYYNKLFVFRISSWDGSWDDFTLALVREQVVEGKYLLSPVFSPDGKYIAYLETDSPGDGEVDLKNPRLIISETEGGEMITTIDLGRYNPGLISIDEWY